MANYSTVAEVDARAITAGDVDWLNCDDKEMTALVNNVGGYSAAAVGIAFDGLTSASGVEAYDILKINSEYLLVTAVSYTTTTAGTLTVTRGYYGSTAAAINNDDTITIKNQRKQTCLDLATSDIVALHGQYEYNDLLWLDGEEGLIEAEERQALYAQKYLEERQSSERIAHLTSGSYGDGAININPVTRPRVDQRAAMIVRMVMRDNEVQANAFRRG